MNKSDILGRWDIVAWEQRYDDGRVTFPFGENPVGYIQYDADDRMVLLITSGDRKLFTTGGQWNASEAEKAAAYSSCLSYAGSYEVGEGEIRHNVEISLFPNWVGGTQKRRAAIVDGQLQLIARLEDSTPEARSATLIWRRPA